MPEPSRPLSEAEEADLAALADGRLDADRTEALEARLAEDPVLADAMARQRVGLTAIAAARDSSSAPLALRTRVEEMQRKAAEPRQRPRLRLPAMRRWLPAAGLAAAAAVAVIVVLALGGAPATGDFVTAALRPPVAAVSVDPGQPALLQEQQDGVRFPNFESKFGWSGEGTRTDEIEDRDTRTVFYRHEGRDVAYTIVGGDTIAWPKDAQKTTRDGVKMRTFRDGDRNVVTWRREGQTCVMSGVGVPFDTLTELAAWKGKGAVSF
jgi:hypothetical protein